MKPKYSRNNCKLTFTDYTKEFFVDETKGIVICKLGGWFSGPTTDFPNLPSFQPNYIERIGKAVCAAGDTFDVNVGKKIALAKAECKVYDTAFYQVWDQINAVSEYIDMLTPFLQKAEAVQRHNWEYISKLAN